MWYNVMPCSYPYLQENFYNVFDGAVSITVALKEYENKVEGSSPKLRFRDPVKLFFFCFRKDAGKFRVLDICRKKHVLMY